MKTRNIDLAIRTKQFSLRIIKLFGSLQESEVARVIGKQLLRSGTSVGAHYREGVRARSPAEFTSKIDGALQELEESNYWLELLEEAKIVSSARLKDLFIEIEELISILVTISKQVKTKKC